ncbi:MAG: 16S rRNA (uracil(1498)-N(3))-methyltransferase [Bacteroidales bacterium]|nr:16S rRNA (uracil(1498)-N(3))-methyltransferase [Bacteroidales bacterium]
MNLFFSTEIDEHSIILNEDEAKHCTKVLRKTVGDNIHVIDGNGNLYLVRIDSIGKRDCVCSILQKTEHFGKHDYYLRMCVAPTKNIDRFEFFVEKAVEIGVDEIIPVCSENSERKILKLDRVERIVLSAMKQSYKAYMPKLSEMIEVDKVITSDFSGKKCIAHCEDLEKILLRNEVEPGKEITILIGPEGDFSITEIELAIQNNWIPVSLGESRLRTETAAIAAVHTVELMNQ